VAVVRFGSHSKGSFMVASVNFTEARWLMGGVVPLLGNENMYTGLYPWLFSWLFVISLEMIWCMLMSSAVAGYPQTCS